MELDRRQFVKLSAGIGTGAFLTKFSLRKDAFDTGRRFELHKKIREGFTVCPYCAVGCGLIVATEPASVETKAQGAGALPPKTGGIESEERRIINCEGDPDHPINRGRLDPKSISGRQLSNKIGRAHV